MTLKGKSTLGKLFGFGVNLFSLSLSVRVYAIFLLLKYAKYVVGLCGDWAINAF